MQTARRLSVLASASLPALLVTDLPVGAYKGTGCEGCEVYPLSECLKIPATVVAPVCQMDVPCMEYDSTLRGFARGPQTFSITFVAPEGDDIVHEGQPLNGPLLWPGAGVGEDGRGTDWPGGHFIDGSWNPIDDGFRFTLDNVEVRFESNPAVSATVPSPGPDEERANPSETELGAIVIASDEPVESDEAPTAVATSVLARTGLEAGPLPSLGGLLALIGATLLLGTRRRRSTS